jgi:hypothetical protein
LILSTSRHRFNSDAESLPVGYKSTILKEFVDTLEGVINAQTLDVGPVCQENITFFAQRMARHYVCDMFSRLKRENDKERHPSDGWEYLDYPGENFDGIQLWDICDYLEDDEMMRLVALCRTMLRASGLLMLIAFEKRPAPSIVNTFVIGQDYRVDIRPQPHLKLPWKFRHNRALTSLLANFTIVRSFRYHSGVREFLFRKPGNLRDQAI